MAVERITPQLVKKGKGKKRPGYRGPGGYQGGASSRGGPPGGGATAGGSGRDFSRGPSKSSKSPSRSPRGPQELGTSTRTVNRITAPPATTRIGGKTYNVTPETRGERQRAELKQQLLNQTTLGGNKIDKFGNTKKSLFRRGTGGIGSLLASLFGMAMGIPGLGLITGGLGKLGKGLGSLNDKIQSTDFARSTSLMDYLDAKKYGGIDARDRKADQTMREARGIQTAMDMRPTTIDPREMARMGLQMPTAPMSKPTFSDPFRNTVGTTANTTNDAVSSNSIPTVNGVPMIDTGSVYQDNLNFFDNLNKGLVVNNEPPMVNTDNVMQGSVLDAQPKKGIMQMISDAIFSPAGAAEMTQEDLLNMGAMEPGKFFGNNLTDQGKALETFRNSATNFYNSPNNTANTPGAALGFMTDPARAGISKYDSIRENKSFIQDAINQGFLETEADYTDQKPLDQYLANGGLASMFTRRG